MTVNGSDAVPVLELTSLSVEFLQNRNWVRVVDDVSFELFAGKTLGLVGESGSGKSVTARSLIGLLPSKVARVVGGTATMEGRNLFELNSREWATVRGRRVAMVFQDPMKSLNPSLTVGRQLTDVIRRHTDLGGRDAQNEAIGLLDRVRIPNAERRTRAYPFELSGGMRQRVAIAIALACKPTVLIADEPTTALDVTIQAQILRLLDDLRHQEDLATLFISHDLGVIAEICDSVHVMYGGRTVEESSVEELFASPQHPYTDVLLNGDTRPARGSTRASDGSDALVAGCCSYIDRCSLVTPTCREHPVDLVEVGDHHRVRCLLATGAGP